MTTVDRNWLFLSMTLITMALVSAVLSFASPFQPSVWVIPVLVFVEFIVYFIASMVPNPKATVGMAFGSALVLTIIRAIAAFAGIIIISALSGFDGIDVNQILFTWVNPLGVVIQAVILIFAGGYILAIILPDLVGPEQAEKLLGGTARGPATTQQPSRGVAGANPTGGFIQVFSYEELSALLKKSPGVEGFMIVSNEGLVVWRDFPMRVDTDVLAAKFLSHSQAISNFVEKTGLTKARRVMVESREHFLFSTTLDQNFSLVLIFNGRVSTEDIMSRLAVLAKTCREFLQWKYPSLPIREGAVKELDMVPSDYN